MENPSTQEAPFGLTESAARRVAFLLKQEKPGAKLRIAVQGGGCSGFQYNFDFDNKQNEDDTLIGDLVLVDQMSLGYMGGSVLDYMETLGAAHFEIRNPNATARCGCGNSFAV